MIIVRVGGPELVQGAARRESYWCSQLTDSLTLAPASTHTAVMRALWLRRFVTDDMCHPFVGCWNSALSRVSQTGCIIQSLAQYQIGGYS